MFEYRDILVSGQAVLGLLYVEAWTALFLMFNDVAVVVDSLVKDSFSIVGAYLSLSSNPLLSILLVIRKVKQ